MSAYIMPLAIFFVVIIGFFKKVNVYNSFCSGVKDGFNLVLDIMPYIVAIMLAISLMRYSGLGEIIIKILAPLLHFFGVPSELGEFIIMRPFTGSGSMAILQDIINSFGPDSKITRIASTIMGSSETVFFVSALYFSGKANKSVFKAIVLMLFVSFLAVVLSCLICNFI